LNEDDVDFSYCILKDWLPELPKKEEEDELFLGFFSLPSFSIVLAPIFSTIEALI
jgi:hypothetical protein